LNSGPVMQFLYEIRKVIELQVIDKLLAL
jgi:hypothetical protein